MTRLKLDDVKKLQQKRHREQLGHFLVEGEHLVLELEKAAKHNPLLQQSQVYITERHLDFPCRFEKQVISEKNMALITDTETPQGIVAVVPLLTTPPVAANERCVYLHELQDPGNLGTILRTLAWFGGFRCLLSTGSVDPFNPKVVRASMGAIFHVPIEQHLSLAQLQQRFTSFAVLDMNGKPLSDPQLQHHTCFIFGNEARGVPRESLAALNTEAFTIAGTAVIESLNVASAVALTVYELNNRSKAVTS